MASDIYRKLKQGRGLDTIGLDRMEHRLLIERLEVPRPRTVGQVDLKVGDFRQVVGQQNLKRGHWEALHFLNCDLRELGLFGFHVVDCVFENCSCQQIGFWNSEIKESEFRHCKLNHSAMGGVGFIGPSKNRFERVVFEYCDLRSTAHSTELYKDCSFRECLWHKVELLGAVFEGCVFEGKLEELNFRNQDPSFPRAPKNALRNCDLKKADVSECRFINIDLDLSCFKLTEDLIVLPRGPENFKEWGEKIHAYRNEGRAWFIKYIGESLGNPAIQSKKGLLEVFTPEEVQALIDIANEKP